MGWTISHGAPNPGGPFDGYHSRNYSSIDDWRQSLLSLTLPAQDSAVLEILTQRRSGDPFEIEPQRAAAIASILRRNLKRMPRSQREMTTTLASAAERAAVAGQPWRWS